MTDTTDSETATTFDRYGALIALIDFGQALYECEEAGTLADNGERHNLTLDAQDAGTENWDTPYVILSIGGRLVLTLEGAEALAERLESDHNAQPELAQMIRAAVDATRQAREARRSGAQPEHQPRMIDLTPVGAQTPEGVERIEKAGNELHDANANAASQLRQLLEAIKASGQRQRIADLLSDSGDDHEGGEGEGDELLRDCEAALQRTLNAGEDFARAVAGQPPLKR